MSDESPSDGTAAEPAATGASPAGPVSTAAPATTATAGQSAEGAELESGRHPVVVQQVDVAGRTVTFDLVQWFQGDAAAKAAAEDGEESRRQRLLHPQREPAPADPAGRHRRPPDVHAPDPRPGGGNAAGGVPVDLATVAANGRDHLFWATIQGGRIQRLEEQYIP